MAYDKELRNSVRAFPLCLLERKNELILSLETRIILEEIILNFL